MMLDIKDYIVEFENIVPDELCDRILEEYELCNDWLPAEIKNGVDATVRNASTILISDNFIISKNQDERKTLDNLLFECAGKAIMSYNEKYPHASIIEDSGYQLLKYDVGQFYTTHTDSFKQSPRAISCSFVLNENYEGGTFSFLNGEVEIKAKKGSALMFPSNFMYPHEIKPVTSGTRYAIVTWFV
jgi:Rps23 Pro-64 3,4-dihydroxylase Tpa1-like proline 4-hydroxylase